MLTLGNIFVLMLLATGAAWVWHNHGLRERALERVKQHCAKLDIELLDGAVALKRIGFVKDASGRRRLARVYNFEFTVTGEARHPGTITQFGAHSARNQVNACTGREGNDHSQRIGRNRISNRCWCGLRCG